MTESDIAPVLAIGSVIVDYMVKVDNTFLQSIDGEKGGMCMVDNSTQDHYIELINKVTPQTLTRETGGSAANTIKALVKLGIPASIYGKVGNDEDGKFFISQFVAASGRDDAFIHDPDNPTGRCISFVTPDGQRTMRTNLGASATSTVEDIEKSSAPQGRKLIHCEGYRLFNPDLGTAELKAAHDSGALVSLDLASFEMVRDNKQILPDLLDKYVDIIFGNEDEAATFHSQEFAATLDRLCSYCKIAVIKLGSKGAIIASGKERTTVPALQIDKIVDTTGAGDFFAAGFLYGVLNNWSLQQCGRLGTFLGSRVCQYLGVQLPDPIWDECQVLAQNIAQQ